MYVLTIEVDNPSSPGPTRSVISFDLPVGGTDADALTIAKGIRQAWRNAFDTRVRVVSFQQTGMTRDIALA
jgi:hypothetical protein